MLVLSCHKILLFAFDIRTRGGNSALHADSAKLLLTSYTAFN